MKEAAKEKDRGMSMATAKIAHLVACSAVLMSGCGLGNECANATCPSLASVSSSAGTHHGIRLLGTLATSGALAAAPPTSRDDRRPDVAALERTLQLGDHTGLGPNPRTTLASLQRTISRGLGAEHAVLVYGFTERTLDRGRLQVWLVDGEGLRASGICERTPRGVAALLGKLHGAIGAELPVAPRDEGRVTVLPGDRSPPSWRAVPADEMEIYTFAKGRARDHEQARDAITMLEELERRCTNAKNNECVARARRQIEYLMCPGGSTIECKSLPSTEEGQRGIASLDEAARRQLDPAAATQAAMALASCLFPGAVAGALDGVRHLAIVPTHFLAIVPFQLLAPDGKVPLVARTAVSVVPSHLALAPLTDGGKSGTPVSALVVGDPASTGFAPLPGARQEACQMALRWHVAPLVGRNATLFEITQRAVHADVLYLATHAYVFPAGVYGRGHEDFIALACGDRWTASEIYGSRLPARLVVLSGCDTTLGLSRESGVAGIGQAFHWAGVPRVVSSLWAVDDDATFRLMDRFAEELGTAEPAEALRLAMDAARKGDMEPWRWASFMVSGSPWARFDVGPGEREEVVATCRDGRCAVVFAPNVGRPRLVCSGKAMACVEAYAGSTVTEAGSLWLFRLENREVLRRLRETKELGASEVTLALFEAWSGGGESIRAFRRQVP